MKTRAELYGREAAMLLRDITMYHVLTKQQLLRLYPMQQEKIEKLLSYLSAEAQRCGDAEFDIPYSRQQLADYLSVERSGLSAELCRMRDEGILAFHKNHFQLLATP